MAIIKALNTDAGKRQIEIYSPANENLVRTIDCANAEDVHAAVARARAAQPAWAALSVDERIEYMHKLRTAILDNQDEIVKTVVDETGKPLQDALIFEVYAVCDFITFYAKQARQILKTQRRKVPGVLKFTKKLELNYKPLGIVGVIAPWNGPFVLTANPCIQALLAGNTVVAKGSEVTPYSSKILQDLCQKAGFPEDVLQVLEGDGITGAALTSSAVDKISFTGSVNTGKRVAAACIDKLIPYTLELGGKDAMIVCNDANLDEAAHAAVWGSCVNTGHYCCGTERIYVEAGIYDAFTLKVTEIAKALRSGQSHGYDEDLGAVFWDQQMTIIESHVDDAKAKGAKVLCGGERLATGKGLYYPATVMTDLDESCDLMTQETFGPIMPIIKVADIDTAIAKANDSIYGLHGSVWTKDINKGRAIAAKMDSGSIAVNDISIMYGIPTAPFGGVKESGFGHVGGDAGLTAFCHVQPVIYGKYGGLQTGYPYSEKTYKQLAGFLNFLYKNPLGRWLSERLF